ASYSCPDGPASSLEDPGRSSCWKGGVGDGWVLLKLHEKALLSFLRVRNRSTSEISISISVRGKRRRDFVTAVKRGIGLAHGNVTDVKIGHLPCVYIRVEGRSRGAGGVSLHELMPVGIPARCVGLFMGPCMEDLTYKSTERLLFGPSLRTSLAPVCPRAALERLILPSSFLRPAGASYDANDPDPVRKGPASGVGRHALHHYSQMPRPTPILRGAMSGDAAGVGMAGMHAVPRPPHPRPPPPPPAPFSSFPGATEAAAGFGGDGGGVVSFDDTERGGGDIDAESPASYAFAPRDGGEANKGLSGDKVDYSRGGGGSGGDGIPYPYAGTSRNDFRHHHHGHDGADDPRAGGDAAAAAVSAGGRHGTYGKTGGGPFAPLHPPQQQRQSFSSSGGGSGGGVRFVGAREDGSSDGRGISPAGAVVGARHVPHQQGGDEGQGQETEHTEVWRDRVGISNSKSSPHPLTRHEGHGFDSRPGDHRAKAGRTSHPYPLESYDEGDDEELARGSDYAGYLRGSGSAGVVSGGSVGSSSSVSNRRRHRRAAAA
ncbi:unnamed protein product, partial [Pylaiella littoralis]